MRTVAQKYREEGKQEGIRIGQEKGKQEGIAEGERKGKLKIAKSMLSKGYSVEDIVLITGLYPSDIQDIK